MKNEPYISNRSLDELRTLLEARNDPVINQYLAAVDAREEDLTVTDEALAYQVNALVEHLERVQREADALEQSARKQTYPEPSDMYGVADRLDEARLNIAACADSIIQLFRHDEKEPVYGEYWRRREEKSRAELEAKKKADKAKART